MSECVCVCVCVCVHVRERERERESGREGGREGEREREREREREYSNLVTQSEPFSSPTTVAGFNIQYQQIHNDPKLNTNFYVTKTLTRTELKRVGVREEGGGLKDIPSR